MKQETLLKLRIAGIVLAFSVGACDLIPGTEAHDHAKAREAVSRTLIDPSSALFQNVRSGDGFVCGEVNAKNRMGAYVGFVRFHVDISNWAAALDPQFNPHDLDLARRLCALSEFERSACTQGDEEEAKRLLQVSFNAIWSTRCMPNYVAGPRAPFDPTRSSGNFLDETGVNIQGPDLQAANSSGDDSMWFAPDADVPLVDEDGNRLNVQDVSNAVEAAPKADRLDQNWLDRAIARPRPGDRREDPQRN